MSWYASPERRMSRVPKGVGLFRTNAKVGTTNFVIARRKLSSATNSGFCSVTDSDCCASSAAADHCEGEVRQLRLMIQRMHCFRRLQCLYFNSR